MEEIDRRCLTSAWPLTQEWEKLELKRQGAELEKLRLDQQRVDEAWAFCRGAQPKVEVASFLNLMKPTAMVQILK